MLNWAEHNGGNDNPFQSWDFKVDGKHYPSLGSIPVHRGGVIEVEAFDCRDYFRTVRLAVYKNKSRLSIKPSGDEIKQIISVLNESLVQAVNKRSVPVGYIYRVEVSTTENGVRLSVVGQRTSIDVLLTCKEAKRLAKSLEIRLKLARIKHAAYLERKRIKEQRKNQRPRGNKK